MDDETMDVICQAYNLPGVHAAAELFPLIEGKEFDELCHSIGTHGLEQDIILTHDGYLLDGRNRLRACYRTGALERFKKLDAIYANNYVGYVVRLNLNRRHLNESQRAVIAARLANMTAGGDKRSEKYHSADLRNDQPSISQPKAAEMLNVSERLVQTVKAVERQAPELIEKIERGEITAGRAMEQVKQLPPKPEPEPPSQEPRWREDEEQRRAMEQVIRRPPVVVYNTGDNEWYTPPMFIELARQVMGGIDLDPASSVSANEVVKAKIIYTDQDNGLLRPWSGRVWLNPPYSSDLIGKFCDKVTTEYRLGNISSAIVLINNATETIWFRTLVECASAVVFPYSRIKFWKPEGVLSAPTQGQAFVYIGPDRQRFLQAFQSVGWGAAINA